jgi:hypothetical protein
LLSALQPGALPEDRIYLLRSRRQLPELLAGTAVAASPPGSRAPAADRAQRIFAPDWLLDGPEIARYDLGADELHVFRAL